MTGKYQNFSLKLNLKLPVLFSELSVSLFPTAESFGNEERGIRTSARVEASELKEGQRTVLTEDGT